MLLYVKHYAQLCNRLWAFLPVLAYAIHKQQRVYVFFALKEYVKLFPHLEKSELIRFFFSGSSKEPTFLNWRFISISEKYNLEIKKDMKDVEKINLFSFVDGWNHRNDVSFIAEHKKKIVKLLRPEHSVINKIESYFNNFDGVTIGVHIRRGDYKYYMGGRFYYDDNVYLQTISKLNSIFKEKGKNCRFLICSNEKFDITKSDCNLFQIENTDGITDLYGLSKCDYIIGPPSSYSQWASFYGDVPLCLMLEHDMRIDLSMFSKNVKLDTFENGKHLVLNEAMQKYELE